MPAEPSVASPDLLAAFIPSGDATMLGGFYRAATGGPAGAVLLLHGLPGHEKNLDLAHDLRQAGFHVLYFHYRGSWGSGGRFSMRHLLPDSAAALAWIAGRPEVDPRRIALVGFSLGGWVALTLAGRSPEIAACAAISPLIDPRRAPLPRDLAVESAATLPGTTADALQSEWSELPSAAPPTQDGQTPTLLVTADRDSLFPPTHYADLALPRTNLRWIRFPRADHAFSDVRPGLRHVVVTWLRQSLARGAA